MKPMFPRADDAKETPCTGIIEDAEPTVGTDDDEANDE